MAWLAAGGEGGHRQRRAAGDGAVAIKVFPGLRVEVTLGSGAEEFPPRITVARPPHLKRFRRLGAAWGLLHRVTQEILKADSTGF